MSILSRISIAACSIVLVPALALAQNPAPAKDTALENKDSVSSVDTIDKTVLTGFYEVAPGRGLTITVEKDALYGAPSSGEKRKLIYQSPLSYAVDKTSMTLTFILGADGRASDLIMAQNGQTRMIRKTR